MMCDTMVALGNSTADGSVLFAKNSDREPNEAHHLLLIPAATHAAGSTVKCTYIEVPQVERTLAVLLAKPFWIWGAEMGANEKGVVIGNEAVFTREPYGKEPGLIGMDFLRLALERAGTARAAMQVMIDLLAQFGQGGNCGFAHSMYYHNSFLIADAQEAWVLETSGRHWAAEKVKHVRSISNAITIESSWDAASPDLVDFAIERGWCRKREEFSFSRCYSDFLYTRFSDARKRQVCSTQALQSSRGRITLQTMMNILRTHSGGGPGWSPDRGGILGSDVCMHAGFGPARGSQSAGSMVSRLTPGVQTHWLTGTAAPCTGIFKPVWMDAGLPDTGPEPSGVYNSACLYWQHEMLHREVLRDYATRLPVYSSDRDRLENEFIAGCSAVEGRSTRERGEFSSRCFSLASQAEARWLELVRQVKPVHVPGFFHRQAWKGYNTKAGMRFD